VTMKIVRNSVDQIYNKVAQNINLVFYLSTSGESPPEPLLHVKSQRPSACQAVFFLPDNRSHRRFR